MQLVRDLLQLTPSRRHVILRSLARALGRAPSETERAYLALLDRRLRALEEVARGRPVSREVLGLGARDRALARRFLRPLHATWHDGDENLVRGHLDRWLRPEDAAAAAAAQSLLAAADALVSGHARREALWFFLWELESMLPDVAPSK